MGEPLTPEEIENLRAKDDELFWEMRRGALWVKRMTADWQTPTDEELTIHRLLATLDAARPSDEARHNDADDCPDCGAHLTTHRPSDETGAWERLGDMLTEKHGESCDCDICLYVQPRVDAALGALPNHPDDGHAHSWGCRRCGVDPEALNEPARPSDETGACPAECERQQPHEGLHAMRVRDPEAGPSWMTWGWFANQPEPTRARPSDEVTGLLLKMPVEEAADLLNTIHRNTGLFEEEWTVEMFLAALEAVGVALANTKEPDGG